MSTLFANPFFQNYLSLLLDPCKSDSHLAVSQSVNHPSESDKVVSSVRDSYLHSGSCGKGISCRHAAAIQTQFDSPLLNVNLGLQISQFNAGRKGITTRTPHRSLLCLGQRLHQLLHFNSDSFSAAAESPIPVCDKALRPGLSCLICRSICLNGTS